MNKVPLYQKWYVQKLEFAVCQDSLGLVGAQGEIAGRAWVVLVGDNTKISLTQKLINLLY